MTQDQYGQAQDAGYGVRGDVIEDENEDYPAGQSKPKTAFQKVASALRGDRPDRDEPDEDQAAADQVSAAPVDTAPVDTAPVDTTPVDTTTVSAAPVGTVPVGTPQAGAPAAGTAAPPTAADSDVVASPGTGADSDVMPQGNPPWPANPNAADTASTPDALDAQDAGGTVRPDLAAGATADPNGVNATADPNGTFAPADPNGTGATAGLGAQQGDYWDDSQGQVADEVEVVAVTTPDVVTDADADPLAGQDADADPLAGQDETVSQTSPDVPDASLAGAQDPGYQDQDPAYQDQAGAATISDVPVSQVPEDSAVTEAPNGAGRHAGAPAQELRPGDATDSLDDLGDLAYGKLLPDAVDFTEQWQQIQFRFVDDPQASVTEAAEVVAQVTAKLEAAIAERQRAIEERQRAIAERQRSLRGRWGDGAEADTETLRETLRMYRAFLDQLIGPKV